MKFKPEDMAFVPEPERPPAGKSGVSTPTRPDAMDHELGMLYKLRLRLQDELHMQVSPFDPMHLAGWRDPHITRLPGLRVALDIVEREIELRNWR